VVFTRLYVPARALRICCSVQPFWTFVRLLGRADASAAKANSFIGMLLRSIVVVVQAWGLDVYFPTLI
jgi:hypothetical protein